MARKKFDYTTRVFARLMGFTVVAAIVLLGLLYALDCYIWSVPGRCDGYSSFGIVAFALVVILLALSGYGYYVSCRIGKNVDRLRDFSVKVDSYEPVTEEEFTFESDELGEISTNIVRLYNRWQHMMAERDHRYCNIIEEEKERARIKRQLTNNINHEIKTPVHAVQGCLETIVMNADRLDKEQILRFVEKSRQQMQRLCSLLNDVSTITRITDGAQHFAVENLDLRDIIAGIEDEMTMQPEQNKMGICLSLPSSLPIEGNKGLLEAIFHNLVSNAIAYSGGTSIFISLLDETDGQYRLSFADNGRGIDPVHFSRLFERFYRLDEGRSRKIGGTGLGLSIVKNAVKFHGGEIKVRNYAGGGLEFVFTLSKSTNHPEKAE